MMARPLSYRPDIDGLRAVAVGLVLVFHFALVPWSAAGFLGVDIFFVISGLLITSILRKQLDQGRFSLKGFYVNRIRRLAPALLVVLVMTAVAGCVLLFPTDLVELSWQVLLSQLYVANFYYWQHVNYFNLAVNDVLLLHTWSLAVEEQFYLAYPAFLFLVYRYARRHFWLAIAVALIASFGLNVLLVVHKPEATFYLLPTRAWELLVGALVPVVASAWTSRRLANEALSILGAGMIVGAVAGYQPNIGVPGWFALLPVGGAAAMLLSGQHRTTCAKVLSLPPVVYVGRISYSLYLVHWPINVFAKRVFDDYSLPLRIGMFCLAIVLAIAVNQLVEEPCRSGKVLGSTRKLLAGYAIGILVTVGGFLVVQESAGLPARFPPAVIRLAGFVNDQTPLLPQCEFHGQKIADAGDLCRIGVSGREPAWIVYGDSHAWALHDAFDEWLTRNNQAGLFLFRHGCAPIAGIHLIERDDGCFQFNRAMMEFIGRHGDIPNVLLVSTWRWPVAGGILDDRGALLDPPAGMRLFSAGFATTVTGLHDAGRRVFLWEPVPGGRGNVPRVLADAAWHGRRADVEFTAEEYRADNAPFFAALRTSRSAVSGVVSTADVLCRPGRCAVQYQDRPLYFDNAHPSRSTTEFWVQVLQAQAPAN